jgi:hypothetical protein
MYISKKNINKIQETVELAIFNVSYYKRIDDNITTFFNENHGKSNSELGDCDFWIEYISLQLKGLRSLRNAYDRYLKVKELGIDINIFPYSVQFTSELVQTSEIDKLVENIVQWENKKESLLNKEVA